MAFESGFAEVEIKVDTFSFAFFPADVVCNCLLKEEKKSSSSQHLQLFRTARLANRAHAVSFIKRRKSM